MSASTSKSQYSRYLGDFRGVDFSSSPAMVEPNRFSYLKNLWKDYESEQGQAIETVPGFRVIMSDLEGLGTIHSIYEYRDAVMVKCGTFLYFCKYNEQKDRYYHDDFDDDPETFSPIKLKDANGSVSTLTLHDGEITAFVFNNDFWFLDGAEYYRYTYGQTYCVKVTDVAYVPTTYIDGEEYEQRNILTNRFREKAFVGGKVLESVDMSIGSSELMYSYTGTNASVIGTSDDTDILIVPDTVTAGGKEYRVTDISANALIGKTFRFLSLPSGISVGRNAVNGCRSLEVLIFRPQNQLLPVILGEISENAFDMCDSIKSIYLGATRYDSDSWNFWINAGSGSTVFFTDIATIYWGGTLDELKEVTGYEKLPLKYDSSGNITNVKTNISYTGEAGSGSILYDLTLFEPCKTLADPDSGMNESVYYNEKPLSELGWSVSATYDDQDYITKLRIYTDSTVKVGGEFDVDGIGEYSKLSTARQKNPSVYDANASYDASTADSALNVLRKCTVTAIFDGRIFFTGNQDLPNTVLYSARDLTSANNPAYIGVYNYFNDGVGDKRNTAMISTPSMLVVCKENTKQDGSCWYHIGQDTGYDLVPRVYPSTQGVSGIGCVGAATNFSDDPVFLSTEGLMAIGKETVNLERTLEHRSSNVDLKLKQCNLKNAKMAEWKGYLVILADGQVFLADSRQLFKHESGVTQYEWFYADDIGVYSGQKEMVSTTSGSIFATVDGKVIDITAPEYRNSLTYSQNGGGNGIVYVNADREPVCYESDRIREPNATIYVDGKETNLKFPIVETDNGFYIAKYIDQYSGGVFKPAVSICETGGRLLLGTTNGMMICFNTDKRGKSVYRAVDVPESYDGSTEYRNPDKDMYFENVSESGMITVDEADYYPVTTGGVSYLTEKIEVNPDEIWHGYYSRNGRTIEAVCETLCDSSAYPHIAKNTVRKSTVIRTKAMGISEYQVFVRSNREQVWKQCRITSRTGNASDTEFPNMSYLTNDIIVSVIPDRMKRWQWQQFRFESNGYCKPFGLLDLFYRYENGGNVK